ncbi:MAG: exodeoxyribonuclease VII large subunit [Chloroflexi bacterium]|nr:exodeoxyribonuclease VII large subunit [Chloroflexota bacterium]
MQPSLFPASPTLTVGELMRHLKALLATDEVVQNLWVRGEVSNFTRAASGHLYFSLKDGESAVRCVMWRPAAQGLLRRPVDGDAVRALGSIGLYEVRGDLQLVVEELQFDGVGALWRQFEALRARLGAEGLFAPERKRPLPLFPRSIGVVTSETGAALQDILRTLRLRWSLAQVVLCPCQVQGAEAPAQIVAAIRALGGVPDVDVIIVARGGGSIEDLWAFNEEVVARAIYASPVCVISGVGHETDTTIADFVADYRAATPTAAAAHASPDQREIMRSLHDAQSRLWLAMDSRITERAGQAQILKRALARLTPQAQIDRSRQRIDEQVRVLTRASQHRLQVLHERVASRRGHLSALNPQAILARGYALVRKNGQSVTRVKQVAPGDPISVTVSDGSFEARVEPV